MHSSYNRLEPRGFYWFLYTIPALLVYIFFMAYPLLDSIRLSMYSGTYSNMTFVGLENFRKIFFDAEVSARYVNALKNTVVFFLYHMLVQNVTGTHTVHPDLVLHKIHGHAAGQVDDAGFGGAAAAPIARRVLDYWLLGLYPSEQDLALVRYGKASAPVGTPRLAAQVPLVPDQEDGLQHTSHMYEDKLLRELLAQPDAYDIVTFSDEKKAPTGFAQLSRAW